MTIRVRLDVVPPRCGQVMTLGYAFPVPQTEPWHLPGEPCYHNNTECIHAQAAQRHRSESGHGGKALCRICAALNRAEAQAQP